MDFDTFLLFASAKKDEQNSMTLSSSMDFSRFVMATKGQNGAQKTRWIDMCRSRLFCLRCWLLLLLSYKMFFSTCLYKVYNYLHYIQDVRGKLRRNGNPFTAHPEKKTQKTTPTFVSLEQSWWDFLSISTRKKQVIFSKTNEAPGKHAVIWRHAGGHELLMSYLHHARGVFRVGNAWLKTVP